MRRWRANNPERARQIGRESYRRRKEQRPDVYNSAWRRGAKRYQERAEERKREILTALGGGCKRCGYNKYVGAIDFHHPADKMFEPARIIRKAKPTDAEYQELMRCIPLCKKLSF